MSREVDFLIDKDTDMLDLMNQYVEENGKCHCILVDEVQFLQKNQVDQLFEIAVLQNIPVICYGLRTDFLMNGFEGSQRLLLLAHSIEELKTICACGKKALLNGRKINGRFVFEGEQIAIEQEEEVTYESLCPSCYFRLRKGEHRMES